MSKVEENLGNLAEIVFLINLQTFSMGAEEDEKTRKKREKMEKKASRGKFVKPRNR